MYLHDIGRRVFNGNPAIYIYQLLMVNLNYMQEVVTCVGPGISQKLPLITKLI